MFRSLPILALLAACGADAPSALPVDQAALPQPVNLEVSGLLSGGSSFTIDVTGAVPHSNLLLVRSNGVAIVWNVAERRFVSLFASGASGAIRAFFHPRLPRVAITGGAAIVLWDVETPELVWERPLAVPTGWVAMAPDGSARINTPAPCLGSTRPSARRPEMASRITVRLTPNSSITSFM